MTTISVKDANGVTQVVAKVPTTGQANPAADSLPVVQPADATAWRTHDAVSKTALDALLAKLSADPATATRQTALIDTIEALVPLKRSALLNGVTTVSAGAAMADQGRPPSFSISVDGTGAVSATVRVQARNTAAGAWVTLATVTLSGTTSAAEGFASLTRYMEYRAEVVAISGTSAAVTATMGS